MIVDYIDAHRSKFGVDPICRVLTEHDVAIAPSTYYAAKKRGHVSAAALREAYAADTVHDLYTADRRLYGVRKMWHAMKRAGHDVGATRSVDSWRSAALTVWCAESIAPSPHSVMIARLGTRI